MDKVDRETLQALHEYLLKELDAPVIARYLFTKFVINDDDLQRIGLCRTDKDKCEELLRILRSKGNTAYSHLIEGLKRNNKTYIVEVLKKKERYIEIKHCLEENLVSALSKEEASTIEEIFDFVKAKDIDVEQQVLGCILEDMFQVTQGSIMARVRTESNSGTGDGITSSMESQSKEHVDEWNVESVVDWLGTLDRNYVSDRTAADFRAQKICGAILRDISEEDLKSTEFPSVETMGERKYIIRKIKELLDDSNTKATCLTEKKSQNETVSVERDNLTLTSNTKSTEYKLLAEKGQPATEISSTQNGTQETKTTLSQLDGGFPKSKQVYKENDRLTYECMKIDDLIRPVYAFSGVDLTISMSMKMAIDILKFTCACLNDRTNGRLLIGVCDNGDDLGKVKGISLTKTNEQYQRMISNLISQCYFEDQILSIKQCIRPLRFVEVIPGETTQAHIDKKYVIEIDIIPMYALCKDEAFFVKLPIVSQEHPDRVKKLKPMELFRFEDAQMKSLNSKELLEFTSVKTNLANLRNSCEEQFLKSVLPRQEEKHSEKLKNILCLGAEKLGDVYPILVCNKPTSSMTDESKSKYAFLQHLPLVLALDFDPDGNLQRFLCEQMEKSMDVVIKLSDFTSTPKSIESGKDCNQTLLDDVRGSNSMSWIYANGFNVLGSQRVQTMSQNDWKKCERKHLRDVIDRYKSMLPARRCVVIFLLLSEEYSTFIEAFEDINVEYPDQWVVIAESEAHANPMLTELLRRNTIEEKDVCQRTVVGMPLEQIANIVDSIAQTHDPTQNMIATSSGTLIPIRQITLKSSFSDLEIVFHNSCEDVASALPNDTLRERELEYETNFYKGEEVSWWNFYFKDHVVQRDQGEKLQKLVKEAMNGNIGVNEDSAVSQIVLYHQPGAGGTTTSKSILWVLRKIYRCVIVSKIQPDITSDQLMELRGFADEKPLPVLLLLDNLEEYMQDLLLELDAKAKRWIRQGGHTGPYPFFVALVCLRKTKLPTGKPKMTRVMLGHSLTPSEKRWFEKKGEQLNKRAVSSDGRPRNDPKLLISFNIMKENFSKTFITEMTQRLVRNIPNASERKLLKYVAMLNAYDLSFSQVPSSAFDIMMVENVWQPGARRGRKSIFYRWETYLSNEFRLLINEAPSMGMSHIASFRITNTLLSKEIISAISQLEGKPTSISDMMLEFLNNGYIFDHKGICRNSLVKIIQRIMTMRERLTSGVPETKYSPLIQAIMNKETAEKAHEVLAKAFEVSEDPFIAQHISRLNMFTHNWPRAQYFSEAAIAIRPDHSFLWDTNARVFSLQVKTEYKRLLQDSESSLNLEELLAVLGNAKNSADKFRKVQSLQANEQTPSSNDAGYFGELEVTLALLHCLFKSDCFRDMTDLKNCLLKEDYYPEKLLKYLSSPEHEENITFIKCLKRNTERILGLLNDEKIQLKDEIVDDYRINEAKRNERKLEKIKLTLDMYLGEPANEPPTGTSPGQCCEYRRRRINQLGGMSFREIIELRHVDGRTNMDNLLLIRKLCLENTSLEEYAMALDYIKLLAAELSLVSLKLEVAVRNGITFDQMVCFSQKLYEIRVRCNSMIHLEPFMFYVMFNWPRKHIDNRFHRPTNELKQIMSQWKSSFLEKYPRQREERRLVKKKESTIFFFTNGSGLNSLTFYDTLSAPPFEHIRGDAIWKAPHVIRTLQRFKGLLSEDGSFVSISIEASGHTTSLEIQTSLLIRTRSMWNKQVFFVIGFTWSGPKAFDVNTTDPTMNTDYMSIGHSANPAFRDRRRDRQQGSDLRNDDLSSLTAKLQQLYLSKNESNLNDEQRRELEKDRRLTQRKYEILLAQQLATEFE